MFCDFAYAEDVDSHSYQRALEIHKGHRDLLKEICVAYYNVWVRKEMNRQEREDSEREKYFVNRSDREKAMGNWLKERKSEKKEKGRKKEKEEEEKNVLKKDLKRSEKNRKKN